MLLPALAVGSRYTARVAGRVADGRVRLELGGALLSARVEAPVTEGETVEIEVIRLLPEVVLRLHRETAAASGGKG